MSKIPFTLRGLVAPVFSPFNNDSTRSLNLSIIPQYASYLASKKVCAVLVNGTTGEGPSMTTSERMLIAETWSNAVKTTNQHLMVQVGGAPLPDVLELAKHAESVKADSILCLPELYFKPSTFEQLTEYLKLVGSKAPNTPLLYYHIPALTNVTVHMAKFLEYIDGKIPNFVGIKFTSINLEEAAQALNVKNKKYSVFLGNNQLISAACTLGIDSIIAASSNILPELVLETFNEATAGNMCQAKAKQEELTKALLAISKHGIQVETLKASMPLLTNINPGPTRPPLKVLSPQDIGTELRNVGYQVRM